MFLEKHRGVVSLGALGALVFACSSSNNATYGDAGPITHPDGGSSGDDSGPGEDAGTCIPAPSVPTPTWVPPVAHQDACTQAELDSFAACLDSQSNTSTACAPWLGPNGASDPTCFTCIQPVPSSATAWGPLVNYGGQGGTTSVNIPGCVALETGDLKGAGCAGSLSALNVCENDACATNCLNASNAALQSCGQAAYDGVCASYLTAANCIEDASAAAQSCYSTSATASFGQIFDIASAAFCLIEDGGVAPSPDASDGSDASDASSE